MRIVKEALWGTESSVGTIEFVKYLWMKVLSSGTLTEEFLQDKTLKTILC